MAEFSEKSENSKFFLMELQGQPVFLAVFMAHNLKPGPVYIGGLESGPAVATNKEKQGISK